MKKWKINSSRVVYKNRLFKLKREDVIIPSTGKPYRYYYEDSSDWVNVVALTRNRNVLLIKQYRHAVREFTLEIPGGIIDRKDKNPLCAAKRELLEETGFSGKRFKLAGICSPNPAIINNKTYTYVAYDAKQVGKQIPDGTEEIEVLETPLAAVDKLIRTGKIKHSLVITALYYARPYLLE